MLIYTCVHTGSVQAYVCTRICAHGGHTCECANTCTCREAVCVHVHKVMCVLKCVCVLAHGLYVPTGL